MASIKTLHLRTKNDTLNTILNGKRVEFCLFKIKDEASISAFIPSIQCFTGVPTIVQR